MYLATILSFIVLYILLKKDVTIAEKEKQLMESRISNMVSQIHQHFLYNSIHAIRELCRQDPEQAREALGDFLNYLRGNIAALSSETPIHFSREISHITAYLKLEKLRFGDRLNVVYDLQEKDFFLPSLTVQPLVENAVKHGICATENGGTVTLRTCKDGNKIVISIIDDSLGFDPESYLEQDDRQPHVGIQNVQNRLQQMMNGELLIESTPGKGTTATITFYVE